MLIDSHCHLDFPDFNDELPQVLARAKGEGIQLIVTICTRLEEFPRVLSISKKNDSVYCTVGVHPHNAENSQIATLDNLLKLAKNKTVIGFGETGLDYYYKHSLNTAQEKSFRTHIDASRITGLPVIVHSRSADDDTIRILKDEFKKGPFTGLIHCFSSGPELALEALDLGFYISISGIITFKSADELRRTILSVPLERLLVETDSPYLAPVPKRGKRNEPAYIIHTAKKLAELKGINITEIADITTKNFFKLFTKAHFERNT